MRRGRAPVVAFANDWGTDPTSKHHLMRLLAARHDVLWIETSGMRAPTATSTADLRRVARKVQRMAGGTRPGAPGLTVLSPPSLPLPTSKLVQQLNARLYRSAIKRALQRMGATQDPVLWVYTPTAARFLDQIPHSGLVYHCVDRWWAFDNYDATEMRQCHEILCQRADHVIVSSLELERDCVEFNQRVTYVPHGVEWEHFHRAVTDDLPYPEGEMDASRPRIGYIGWLETWVDMELIAKVARAHPDHDVVCVGAIRGVDTSELESLPNVHILGRKAFAALPAYLRWFDVALIPFRVNELTVAVNPIKLREYLSAGVPVVTTALPELAPFRGREGVDVVDSHDEFLAAVARRLDAPSSPDARMRLSESMRGEGWQGRLDLILNELGDILEPRVAA